MKKFEETSSDALAAHALTVVQQEAIVKILKESIEPVSIILFGSLAKGTYRPDSDLDLAYIADKLRPNAYERFRIASNLADAVGREVDLIDFDLASPVLRVQIIDSGILLYEDDPRKRQELFMRSLKEYAMLNEERREIIRNRMREGRV
ncbi:type VII toxin-antitoxin system MntA family adenylyltransferase antitoxin [Gorillibacterium sp. sgz500922]|uniref:type VII toxin-antitoxin system MntA family adenylyltransferase antitoxin n=1 Tax=Gorillibacterium sp. sgz500922 TaxID=3446694 RepID=UPI003F677420